MNMTHLEVNLVQHNGMWMDKDARDHMVALEDTANEIHAALIHTKGLTIIERINLVMTALNGYREAVHQQAQRIVHLESATYKYRAAIEQLTGIPESVELVPALQEAVDKAGIKVDTNRAPGTIRPWTKPKVMTGHIDFE